MLFNSKRNFKDHMMHALVGFFVGAAVMSLLSSKSAGVSETEANEQKRFDGADDRPPLSPLPLSPSFAEQDRADHHDDEPHVQHG